MSNVYTFTNVADNIKCIPGSVIPGAIRHSCAFSIPIVLAELLNAGAHIL